MPTYEYVCEKCGHQFEQFQPISAKTLTLCPEDKCAQKKWGKGKVKRAITAGAGIIFKGSGFYSTDYRSDNYKESAKKDKAPATSSAGESKSGGGESKPGAGASKSGGSESKPSGGENKSAKTESKPVKSPSRD